MATPELGPGVRVEYIHSEELGPFTLGSKWLCIAIFDPSTRAGHAMANDYCQMCGSKQALEVLGVPLPVKHGIWRVFPCVCAFRPIDDGDIVDRKAENTPIKFVVGGKEEVILHR